MGPIKPFLSDRIDFRKIREEFAELAEEAADSADIAEFTELVQPLVQRTIGFYYHLLSDENYREGEFAGLQFVIMECVNALIPAHIPYVAAEFRGDELIFVMKEKPKIH